MSTAFTDSSFRRHYGITDPMLDDKALDANKGPFGRPEMYFDYVDAARTLLSMPSTDTLAIITKKKNAVIFLPVDKIADFLRLFPAAGNNAVRDRNALVLCVPEHDSSCRQAVAALVLRACGVPIRIWDFAGATHARRLATAWGASSMITEIDRALAERVRVWVATGAVNAVNLEVPEY